MASRSDLKVRHQVAQQAARLMVEDGITSFVTAKQKAASHLRVSDQRKLPNNAEIETAILEYQRLFYGETQQQTLLQLRRLALQAMQNLKDFSPHLVGPVLSGTANRHTPVSIHLFTDVPEEVFFKLKALGIPCRSVERRLKTDANKVAAYPACCFVAGDTPVELIIFPYISIRQPPLSLVDNKPIKRANLAALASLIAEVSQ